MALHFFAPVPRPPRQSEKQYITILPDGSRSPPRELPCWIDRWSAEKEAEKKKVGQGKKVVVPTQTPIEDAELFMSVVVPAYNEEERLTGMLEEAVDYLQAEYGGETGKTAAAEKKGWEIVLVSDGSTDATVDKALEFAREHQLSLHSNPRAGPWAKDGLTHTATIPHGSIRVVQLEANRGKGGAVTHGLRHVRGRYVVFADADGASRFNDLGKLVDACRGIEDKEGRGVAIGSRAHLVGSEAVVKVRIHLEHDMNLDRRIDKPLSAPNSATSSCTPSTCSSAS